MKNKYSLARVKYFSAFKDVFQLVRAGLLVRKHDYPYQWTIQTYKGNGLWSELAHDGEWEKDPETSLKYMEGALKDLYPDAEEVEYEEVCFSVVGKNLPEDVRSKMVQILEANFPDYQFSEIE